MTMSIDVMDWFDNSDLDDDGSFGRYSTNLRYQYRVLVS